MTLDFYKYQGTGNDFIIIDNRLKTFNKNNTKIIADLCDRRFGIGADGLILLENHEELDFTMVYFNADGHPSSMCGNGGRCIVAFAKYLGLVETVATFMAIDGVHSAKIKANGSVELQMQDVSKIDVRESHLFLDTGSPHHIEVVEDLNQLNVKKEGSSLRNSDLYGEAGSNINFVQALEHGFGVRTYERGVEDETLSCGTGVTAVALAMHYSGKTEKHQVKLETEGGELQVRFKEKDQGYYDIWLIGPATQVFKGVVVI